MNNTIFLTTEGKAKLQSELKELTGPRRDSIARRLKHAIEMGDLSENADYKMAKEEQSFLEGRIQEIEMILKVGVIIEKEEMVAGQVNIGSRVTVQEQGYPSEEYELVGKNESNPRERKISYESPIGKALMGRKVGDTAQVELPNKTTIELKILYVK